MSPELAFVLTLALRMAFAAAFVVTASIVTERSGPVIGALIATLPIFFAFTYPGNVATENWTVVADNWQDLRTRWEYSHAVNAILTFASFCLMTAAVLAFRR